MQGNITDWGKEVKKGLIERGWSINDLAERIGKSRTRVSGVVNGRIYSDSTFWRMRSAKHDSSCRCSVVRLRHSSAKTSSSWARIM